MPAQLAALIFWIFALTLLVIDYRKAPPTLAGLWAPVCWLVILGSRMPSYWFESGQAANLEATLADGNAFNQRVFGALIAWGLVIVARRRIDWAGIIRQNSALAVFVTLSLCSILWAEDGPVAIRAIIKALLGNVVMALIVVTDPNPLQAVKTLIRRTAFLLIPLSVLAIKYFPLIGRTTHRWSYETMFQGVATGGNGLAATCFVCGLVIIWNLLRKGAFENKTEFRIDVVLLSMIVWLLNKADGGTALFSLILGTVVMLALKRERLSPAVLLAARRFGVVLLFVVPLLILNYSWFIDRIGSITGSSETLYGRVELWKLLVALGGNPLVGLGYANFWQGARLEALWEVYWWRPTQAHNGYLETYLNLGLVGVAALFALILSAVGKAATRSWRPELRLLKLSFLIPIVLFNLTEAAFRGLHIMWFLFLVLALETRQQLQDECETETETTRSVPPPLHTFVPRGQRQPAFAQSQVSETGAPVGWGATRYTGARSWPSP